MLRFGEHKCGGFSHGTAPQAEYQAANDPARPLDSLRGPALNAALISIAEKIAAAARTPKDKSPKKTRRRKRMGRSASALRLYGFDRPVVLMDIDYDWRIAFFKWSNTHKLEYVHEMLLSNLPSRSGDDGQELDYDKLNQTLDYLVGGTIKPERCETSS